jgi:hypothetical protein
MILDVWSTKDQKSKIIRRGYSATCLDRRLDGAACLVADMGLPEQNGQVRSGNGDYQSG